MNLRKIVTSQEAVGLLDRYFEKIMAKKPGKPLQVKIVSQKLGLDYTFPIGSDGLPYHTASIGKVFTAVLIQMLAEKGLYSIKDHLQRFFSPVELDRLFVYNGIDYAAEVTIEQLLGHTSGIADFFEGKTIDKTNFIREILANPDDLWTPQKLVDFTRDHQTAVGRPGDVFNYSDTGYDLLGLLIEKVSGKSLAENLMEKIILPLEMYDSYLMFHTEPVNQPKQDIQPVWLFGVEISRYQSISCDWAGGGIVTTTADLLKFDQALREGHLISEAALATMDICTHRFRPGIYYGLGMMQIRFKDFFFLLGGLPKIKGHIGILATHMFYDPLNDAHIIMNFGDESRMVESFQSLIEIENTLKRIKYDSSSASKDALEGKRNEYLSVKA